jgi:hypothetical protein
MPGGIEAESPMTGSPDVLPPGVNTDSPVCERAARRRWWFLATLFVFAPLLLVAAAMLTAMIWFATQYSTAYHSVQAEVARIQSAGEPITARDLHAYHQPGLGVTDTTGLWLVAFDSFDEQQFSTDAAALLVAVDGAPQMPLDSALAPANDLLAKHNKTVQLALAASKAEGECRFPVQFEVGLGATLPHLDKARPLARLMQLRARAAAANEKSAESVESIEVMFATSRALSDQVLLIEHRVRLATAMMALREVETLLSEMELADQQLATLQMHVEELQFQGGLTSALLGERALGYHASHHMESMSNGEFIAPANPGEGKLWRPADCALYLELFRELIDASRASWPVALDRSKQPEQRLKQLAGAGDPLERYNATLTLLVMPATAKSFEATGRNLALREAVLAAVAAERHRLAHGKLPAKLTDVVPEFLSGVPTDPFDAQPLRMKSSDEVLVFYSVGKDRNDDGGVEQENRGEPDIVVTLRRRNE